MRRAREKTERLEIRISPDLLSDLRARARELSIPVTALVVYGAREALSAGRSIEGKLDSYRDSGGKAASSPAVSRKQGAKGGGKKEALAAGIPAESVVEAPESSINYSTPAIDRVTCWLIDREPGYYHSKKHISEATGVDGLELEMVLTELDSKKHVKSLPKPPEMEKQYQAIWEED